MQVIFSSADEIVIKVLSKRGIENVDAVLLFDALHFDEAVQKKTEEEVLKYLDEVEAQLKPR